MYIKQRDYGLYFAAQTSTQVCDGWTQQLLRSNSPRLEGKLTQYSIKIGFVTSILRFVSILIVSSYALTNFKHKMESSNL